MVYELRCYTLKPGKMPEYLKAAETIGRPARGQNYGVNHGYWTAEFGALNQIEVVGCAEEKLSDRKLRARILFARKDLSILIARARLGMPIRESCDSDAEVAGLAD